MADRNFEERKRLFADARSIEISSYTLELGCKLVASKMLERKGKDAFLETTRNGKKVFVGWISRWGNDYHVTFMGHTFAYEPSFEKGVEALLKLGHALHNNDYTFVYGV